MVCQHGGPRTTTSVNIFQLSCIAPGTSRAPHKGEGAPHLLSYELAPLIHSPVMDAWCIRMPRPKTRAVRSPMQPYFALERPSTKLILHDLPTTDYQALSAALNPEKPHSAPP